MITIPANVLIPCITAFRTYAAIAFIVFNKKLLIVHGAVFKPLFNTFANKYVIYAAPSAAILVCTSRPVASRRAGRDIRKPHVLQHHKSFVGSFVVEVSGNNDIWFMRQTAQRVHRHAKPLRHKHPIRRVAFSPP